MYLHEYHVIEPHVYMLLFLLKGYNTFHISAKYSSVRNNENFLHFKPKSHKNLIIIVLALHFNFLQILVKCKNQNNIVPDKSIEKWKF